MSQDPASSNWHEVRGADLLLRLRIQPRATPEGINGVHDGRLRVRISAAPVDGAANERLIAVLAHALGVPRSSLSLVRGTTSKLKEILVRAGGARRAELVARLEARFS